MLIQTPGSFVWSASLAARLGVEGWSTWGVFLVTGCLQGCLLVMGICFEVKARRAANGDSVSNTLGPWLEEGTNFVQPTATCVVGYIPTGRAQPETDDEGGANVEDERTPLMNGSKKKPSRKDSKKSSRTPAP